MCSTKEIRKVKNFEGKWFTCTRCGSEIKHAYRVGDDPMIYGSDCVFHIAGISKKKIKEQNSRMKSLQKILNNKKVYAFDDYKDALGITEDDLCDKFMRTGSLG